MTDQERQLIEELASRIQKAPPPQVDRDADDLIRRGIGSRPDALYILTQTVLIQEMALNQAKAQLDQLKQAAPQSNASFLGQQAPAQPSGYQGSNYQRDTAAPPQHQPQYAPPQYEAPPPPSGGRFSGFLHNAAQTAAGIVAGEVAFSAISSLFGGHGGGGGFFGGGGSGFLGGGGVSPGSETIINNYYDDRGDQGSGSGSRFGSSDGGLSPDIEDRRFAGDGSQDDSQDNSSDDSGNQDDSQDDSGDDGSSYDDGSGSSDV